MRLERKRIMFDTCWRNCFTTEMLWAASEGLARGSDVPLLPRGVLVVHQDATQALEHADPNSPEGSLHHRLRRKPFRFCGKRCLRSREVCVAAGGIHWSANS